MTTSTKILLGVAIGAALMSAAASNMAVADGNVPGQQVVASDY